MAITQTTYTGNGSTTNYSFTFEYLKQADVKVTLDTVATTAFTFANATTLSFNTLIQLTLLRLQLILH